MNEEQLIDFAQQAIILTIKLSLPILLVGLIVGVSIALLQALTQIQEITLVFVPKILAIFMALFLFFPIMMKMLVEFTEIIAQQIINIG